MGGRLGFAFVAAVAALVAASMSATSPSAAPPRADTATRRPIPPTAQRAIRLVQTHRDTDREASPFRRELRWLAEWRGDRWWVLGLFESDWGVRFVVDAAIINGRVDAYINYGTRPRRRWIRKKVRRWRLRTLYTRLTPAAAVGLARESLATKLRGYTVLDGAAKLARDSARSTAWYFVYYARTGDGRNVVLAVDGYGGRPVEERSYAAGYGFGLEPQLHDTVPLPLRKWVQSVATRRGWQPTNL